MKTITTQQIFLTFSKPLKRAGIPRPVWAAAVHRLVAQKNNYARNEDPQAYPDFSFGFRLQWSAKVTFAVERAIVTIILPLLAGRFTTSKAATDIQPVEIPTRRTLFFAETPGHGKCIIISPGYIRRFEGFLAVGKCRFLGINPSVLQYCEVDRPKAWEITGESLGSTGDCFEGRFGRLTTSTQTVIVRPGSQRLILKI